MITTALPSLVISLIITCIQYTLFDTLIIETHKGNLITDYFQFGYKKQSSTIVCTSLLLNTVAYYREVYYIWRSLRGCPGCQLDATEQDQVISDTPCEVALVKSPHYPWQKQHTRYGEGNDQGG